MADKIIGYGKGTFTDRRTNQLVKWAKLYCTAPMQEKREGDSCFVGTRSYALSVDYNAADTVFAEVLIGEEHECLYNQYGKVFRVSCGANPL